MNALIALALMAADGPTVDGPELVRLLKARAAPLKSVAFVYEGTMTWTGPMALIKDPKRFNERYQGSYLYRSDGAALYDVYVTLEDPGAIVQRKRMAILNGRFQRSYSDFKVGPGDAPEWIGDLPGSIEMFDKMDSPHRLFWTWSWTLAGDDLAKVYRFEGWEEVEGRNCLRFALVPFGSDHNFGTNFKESRNFERYWVDVERNAHVVRMEFVRGGKTAGRVTAVLNSFPLPDGSHYWLPVRGLTSSFVSGEEVSDKPFFERTIAVVAGSVRLNADMPDSLFSLRRDPAIPLPGELAEFRAPVQSGELPRRFEAQPAPPPIRPGRAGAREPIEQSLAEAGRRPRQPEAPSPARQRRIWSTPLPHAFGLLGLGLGLLEVVVLRG